VTKLPQMETDHNVTKLPQVETVHNVTKLPQVKDNKSHVKHILHYMCQICLTIFFTHGVPNTSQEKPPEDNFEAYFTQYVSKVTLCRCHIYSIGNRRAFC
jgi:hypothetical protein